MRSSTAVSESKPRSPKARSASMSSALERPSTVAALLRTSSTSSRRRCSAVQPVQACASPDFEAAALSVSSTSAPAPAGDQIAQHRRHAPRGAGECGGVDAGGHQHRRRPASRCRTAATPRAWTAVPARSRLMRALSRSPRCRVMALACSHSPQPSDDRRQAVRPPVRGQPVQEAVGRRVVGLARRAHDPGHRRKHHERRQIQIAGQLVQVPRRRRPWPATPRPPAPGVNDVDHRVVEHPGGVNHAPQRYCAGMSAITAASAARSAASQATTCTCGARRARNSATSSAAPGASGAACG